MAWVLSLFYFVTFGGFVAFSIYLPTLLRDQFHLSPADAGVLFAASDVFRSCGDWENARRWLSLAEAAARGTTASGSPEFWRRAPLPVR